MALAYREKIKKESVIVHKEVIVQQINGLKNILNNVSVHIQGKTTPDFSVQKSIQMLK